MIFLFGKEMLIQANTCNMLKIFMVTFVIFLLTVTSAGRGIHSHPPDEGDKLQGKSDDRILDELAMKKELFQDIFLERQPETKLQFGYVCENPIQWEQRFEEKDFLENRHRGKVKWADIDGGYGEHYWDINHR